MLGVRVAITLVILFATTTVRAAAPVRVATFNVYNYLVMDRRVDGHFRPHYPKPEKEKTAVRTVIREFRPDVLALQEIGPASYLEELRRDLADEGCIYPYGQVLEAADPERHVAVLSRLPFARVNPHPEITFKYFGEPEPVKRGLLEVTFASPSGNWTLFIVHLKSRYTDRVDDPMSADRRVREARAVRDVILEEFPRPTSARFIIAGDLNDTTGSKALIALRQRGGTKISELLPTMDSRGETWTHRYEKEDTYSRVDFLLVSPGLLPSIVRRQATIDDGAASLDGSDHRLVYLDLEVGRSAPTRAAAPEPRSKGGGAR